MDIICYRYGSICEPDVIEGFQKLLLTVHEIKEEITNKNISASARVALVSEAIQTYHPLFVFSINFFPAISDICHIYKIPYLCWTVDSPVLELFSPSLLHNTNRIFLFDRAQYELYAPYNPNCIFHLPLASAVERFDKTLKQATQQDYKRFQGDISFVGSLYSEKNPMRDIKELPPQVQGYIDAIMAASLKVYGYNFIEETLTDTVVESFKRADKNFYAPEQTIKNCDSYVVAHRYIGSQIAQTERINTLNTLAKHFSVDLYTRSDTTPLTGVHVHGGVASLTQMPIIFSASKINLNMTIKPIQTGLPLRIFDILGCGGFLMTNYQSEITDYFEIGVDLEAYSDLEELIDKCTYYLSHDDVRKQIAINGYNKVRNFHTYQKRLLAMLQCVTN